jgi:serine/threonine protein kinase
VLGKTISHYKVLEKIGEGGMGEVYLAEDSRLDRKVALKILPEHLSDRAELRERFEREARAVSSLNHPHICTLYDVGETDGIHYLVMEHLEGETLSARLEKGALPLEQTLEYAIQIADALDKAHRQGVVHRDLKPGNIMLTKSGAKLLDFGLAKLQAAETPTNLSALPTEQANLTAEGTILGTLQYMAPEQLEGKEADSRTDIFAFGATVYEMATGQKAFEGKSQASLIAAIMGQEPPAMADLQPMTPSTLDHIVRRCLVKEPDRRWQAASDVTEELNWVTEVGTQGDVSFPVSPSKGTERTWMTLAGVFFLISVALVFRFVLFVSPVEDAQVMRWTVDPPEGATIPVEGTAAPWPTISPDGKYVALAVHTEDGQLLTVRSLDALTARTFPGTQGAYRFFWSPDSRSVGFASAGKLQKIDIDGGTPQVVCCDAIRFNGGTWNREGTILFSPAGGGGLYRVSASGGEPEPVTTHDLSREETAHTYPDFLPDGNHFLYRVGGRDPKNVGVYIGSLDSPLKTFLLNVNSRAIYRSGHLLYLKNGDLMAQSFDLDRMELSGEPVRVAEDVASRVPPGDAAFSASTQGVLVYQAGRRHIPEGQLTWFDRQGNPLERIGEIAAYGDLTLSPDQRRVAASLWDADLATLDVWIIDLVRGGVSSRLTTHPSNDYDPAWSHTGEEITFVSERDDVGSIYRKALSGTKGEELVWSTTIPVFQPDWSQDGGFLAFSHSVGPNRSLWVLPMPEASDPFPVVQGNFQVDTPEFSPNGGWLAYESLESGQREVYIQPFQRTGEKLRVSTNGGMSPKWRGDSQELFYIASDGVVMAVEIGFGDTVHVGDPKPLFQTVGTLSRPGKNLLQYDVVADLQYDVAVDGQQFLMITQTRPPEP